MGRYTEPVIRVLSTYPPGQSLVTALETLIATAQQHAEAGVRDKVAQEVCEGLHVDPASGLKCRKCWEAENRLVEESAVEAEIAAAQEER